MGRGIRGSLTNGELIQKLQEHPLEASICMCSNDGHEFVFGVGKQDDFHSYAGEIVLLRDEDEQADALDAGQG